MHEDVNILFRDQTTKEAIATDDRWISLSGNIVVAMGGFVWNCESIVLIWNCANLNLISAVVISSSLQVVKALQDTGYPVRLIDPQEQDDSLPYRIGWCRNLCANGLGHTHITGEQVADACSADA